MASTQAPASASKLHLASRDPSLRLVNLSSEIDYLRRDVQLEQLCLLRERQGEQSPPRVSAISQFYKMFNHCPFPAWIKDRKFVMLAHNPAYTELYEHAPKDSFVGHGDTAWDSDTADAFHRFDAQALARGYAITHEQIPRQKTGINEDLLGAKWVWTTSDGEDLIVGIVTGNMPLPRSALHDELHGNRK